MLRIVRMTIGSRNHPRYLLSSTVLQVPLHTPQDRVGQAYVRDVGEVKPIRVLPLLCSRPLRQPKETSSCPIMTESFER